MGTTGHPYWAAVERWRRWLSCMMANSTWNLATAFSWRPATQHQAITGSLYSEENVDDSTSLDYYIVPDILDDIRCESSTTWCRQIVELLFFYAVATYKKIWRHKILWRHKVQKLASSWMSRFEHFRTGLMSYRMYLTQSIVSRQCNCENILCTSASL